MNTDITDTDTISKIPFIILGFVLLFGGALIAYFGPREYIGFCGLAVLLGSGFLWGLMPPIEHGKV
jgi:hypothetical protein